MRPDLVILSEPDVDGGLSLSGRVEPLGVQNLLAQGSVEAFIVSVFPRAARIDPDGFDADLDEPLLCLAPYV
jgi:hypothetical protein